MNEKKLYWTMRSDAFSAALGNRDISNADIGAVVRYFAIPGTHKPHFEGADVICEAIRLSIKRAKEQTAIREAKKSRARGRVQSSPVQSSPVQCVCAPDGAHDAHTHDLFSLEDVNLAALAKLEIPRRYAEERYREWKATGFLLPDGKRVEKTTFLALVNSFWKHEKDRSGYDAEIHEAKTALRQSLKNWTATDWALCHERMCRNAGSAANGFGCKYASIPPAKREERPYPPEECPAYARQ